MTRQEKQKKTYLFFLICAVDEHFSLTIKCTETAHNCSCGKTCKIVKMYIRKVIGPDIQFIKQIGYLAEVHDLH